MRVMIVSSVFCRILSLIFFSVGCGSVHAEIYKWVDDSGQVHFGDEAKSTSEKVHLQEINGFEQAAYKPTSDLVPQKGKVLMYSTSWCGYCKKARRYFSENSIVFTEFDIEKNALARRQYDRLGGKGVPVILVGKRRMNGFSISGFKRIYD